MAVVSVPEAVQRDEQEIKAGRHTTYCARYRDAWGVDPDLVLDFVYVYARFEYALKRAGYLKPDLDHAEGDWVGFGHTLHGALAHSQDPEVREAAEFLRENPPTFQVDADTWRPFEIRHRFDDISLLLLISQIRNNLFHGGENPCDSVEDCNRDEQLLRASLTLLCAALGTDERVRLHFESDCCPTASPRGGGHQGHPGP